MAMRARPSGCESCKSHLSLSSCLETVSERRITRDPPRPECRLGSDTLQKKRKKKRFVRIASHNVADSGGHFPLQCCPWLPPPFTINNFLNITVDFFIGTFMRDDLASGLSKVCSLSLLRLSSLTTNGLFDFGM